MWLRGGFPDASLAEDSLRTLVERDIARYRLTLSSEEVRHLVTMLAHLHGGILNYSNLGRAVGYTYHTVQNLLGLLETYFLIRRLAPYNANVRQRLVKAPKVYIRDSGLLHHLLGIRDMDALFTSPYRGNSFKGFMIEQIVTLENLRGAGSSFYFFRTHTGAEIDLLVDRGRSRVGVQFKAAASTGQGDWTHLQFGIENEVIDQGIVVYKGSREFAVSDSIRVVPAVEVVHESRSI